MANEDLYDLLKQLLQLTSDFAETKLKDGILIPNNIPYQKWKMNDFEYGKDGVINKSGITSEIVTKKDWSNSISTVTQHALSMEVAKKIQNMVSQNSTSNNLLSIFLSRFLQNYFDGIVSLATIDESCLSFVRELKGEPVQCKAVIQLLGIAIEPQSIDLNNGITIRQTKKEDIETWVSSYSRGSDILNYPSSIMEIVSMAKQPAEFQSKIENAINILKLFKVGSIRYKSYRMYSQSLNPMYGGTLSSMDELRPTETCFIHEKEIPSLKKFWQALETHVTKLRRLSSSTDVTFRDIAFARYEDSLMHVGVIERKIADCMMGFESIFLRDGGEQQELSYRLRLRVAKLMSLLGHNPFEVKKIILDAYAIRSKFVHGGLLDYDGRKSLSEKYGNEKNLLLQLLDYLRISIIVTLLMHAEKPKLIDTIDGSFLDKKSETELEQIVIPAKHALDIK